MIHGADERLIGDIGGLGGGNAGLAAVMAKVNDWGTTWDGSSASYSAAYAGMRYLDAEIKAAGGEGIKDVMTYLAADSSRTLDQALQNASSGRFTGVADFKSDFQADGAAFIADLRDTGKLTDADTGAIGGANASGGAVRTATSVVQNFASRSGEDQLSGFTERWETLATADFKAESRALQIGSEPGQTLDIGAFDMTGAALDIMDADVVNSANRVIKKMDRALEYVDARRADVGAGSIVSNPSSPICRPMPSR